MITLGPQFWIGNVARNRPAISAVALAEQPQIIIPVPVPVQPVILFPQPGQAGGTGRGSRTRNYQVRMSRKEFSDLIASLPVEEQTEMRIEVDNTEIEWLLSNL